MRRHADLIAARRRQLRDGEPQLVRLLGGADAAPLDRPRAARPPQRLRHAVAPSALGISASRPTRRSGASPASTTCTCTACRESSRRLDDDVIGGGARLPDAARRGDDDRDAGVLLRPVGRHGADDLAATRSPDFLFLCGGGILAHPGRARGRRREPARRLGRGEGRRGARRSRASRARRELQRALDILRRTQRVSAWRPRIAWYGDDFTGATDTLATATQGGLRALLFLRVPTPEMLAAAGALDCIGIAGASRSMAPADMENELRPGRGLLRAARRAGRALQDLLDLRQRAGDRQHRGGAARAAGRSAQPLRPDRRRPAEHRALLRVRKPVRRGARPAGRCCASTATRWRVIRSRR